MQPTSLSLLRLYPSFGPCEINFPLLKWCRKSFSSEPNWCYAERVKEIEMVVCPWTKPTATLKHRPPTIVGPKHHHLTSFPLLLIELLSGNEEEIKSSRGLPPLYHICAIQHHHRPPPASTIYVSRGLPTLNTTPHHPPTTPTHSAVTTRCHLGRCYCEESNHRQPLISITIDFSFLPCVIPVECKPKRSSRRPPEQPPATTVTNLLMPPPSSAIGNLNIPGGSF
ncbi:unnamed protein product [Lactuca virosa]|uniref:Uncharacterized protein n=1 Tax=Lactuca virosa TaxID=75947 RepID=A0AAU9M3Z3_9ASTR|nr:unnamed protein product [Lactuca virosa]